MKRRVSRVESLRNLFFNRGNGQQQNCSGPDARKGFLLAKKRARSAENKSGAEKVDKAIGTGDDEGDVDGGGDFHGRQQQLRRPHPRHFHGRRRQFPHPRQYGYYTGGGSSDTASEVGSLASNCCNCNCAPSEGGFPLDEDDLDYVDNDDALTEDGTLMDDSVSQISAMDSASQTGGAGGSLVEGGSGRCHHRHCRSGGERGDPLLPTRSMSVGELAQGSASSASSSFGNGSGGHRRGQFPYAYIRSKLSVLPEEQAGQLSRRESMNQVRKI